MNILFIGHRTFYNKGCEAIVRTTVGMLRSIMRGVKFLVPSTDIARDSRRWPEAQGMGVVFIPDLTPRFNEIWKRAQRLRLVRNIKPDWPLPLNRTVRSALENADVVLSIGGDLYSLDYDFPSLLITLTQQAVSMKKPTVLWGASVGPFQSDKRLLSFMRSHLSRLSFIGARESLSLRYLLEDLGISCPVHLVADPAFMLEPQEVDVSDFWPKSCDGGVLGINISPHIERRLKSNGARNVFLNEMASFLKRISRATDLGFLLVPHVVPWDGSKIDNDEHLMRKLMRETGDIGGRLSIAPGHLNAPETKYVISRCRFFMGARTHSTIAAMSSGVPTISLAYSVKAEGINVDIFGHSEWVVPTRNLSHDHLGEVLDRLMDQEDLVREHLQRTIPETKRRAVLQAQLLRQILLPEGTKNKSLEDGRF